MTSVLKCWANVLCSIHCFGELKCVHALRGPTFSDIVEIMDQGNVMSLSFGISIYDLPNKGNTYLSSMRYVSCLDYR